MSGVFMGFGKDGKGTIGYLANVSDALGTLASQTVLKSDVTVSPEDDFRLLKTETYMSESGGTAGEAVLFGIADNELTITEIKECLEAEPKDRNDAIGNERALRAVFPIGVISLGAAGNAPQFMEPIVTKPRWTFSDTEGWCFFYYNFGPAALTTGSIISLLTKFYGVWLS